MTDKSTIRDSGSFRLERIVMLRIKPGEDLLAGIREGILIHEIKSGIFISGVGALRKAVLRNLRVFPDKYPVTPENRLYFEVNKPLELLGISGWIGEKSGGEPEIHGHFSVSYVDGEKVVGAGGHLVEGNITSIKVVVTIGVLSPGTVLTAFDEESQSLDIDFDNNR